MFCCVPSPALGLDTCYLLKAAWLPLPDMSRPDPGSAPMLAEVVAEADALVCGRAGALQAGIWVVCSALPGASLGCSLRS